MSHSVEKPAPTATKVPCIYARVSTKKQEGDLQRQVAYLKEKYPTATVYSDIASSLKYNRPKLLRMVKNIQQGLHDMCIVTHKDRLARFGFEFFEFLFDEYGAHIKVDSAEDMADDRDELSEDLLSVMHHFSGKMYAIRSHERHKK